MMLSLEAFAAVNFLMNLLILLTGLYGVRHVCRRGVLTAALLGTAYAAAVFAKGRESLLGSFPVRLTVLLGMAGLAQGRWRSFSFEALLRMTMSAVFSGGVMQLAGRVLPPAGMAAVGITWLTVAAAAVYAGPANGREKRQFVRLQVQAAGVTVEVKALIDTGNRLREPVSGLPVLIIGKERSGGICPASTGCLRSVRYGVLGGEGEILCIRPESVCKWTKCGWRKAPDVWIGLFDGEIPSGVEAIAPPSLG